MTKWHLAVGLLFSAATGFAQTGVQNPYRGQSWVGLLVAGSCETNSSNTSDRMRSSREADLTTSGRTTTPAVDDAGTRGSAASDATQPTSAERLPRTGDVMARVSSADPGWIPARKQAQTLGASCLVNARTTKFALLLPDGSMMQFDEVANQSIARQLPSFPSGTRGRKVLRVLVEGKIQEGKIALDNIRM